MSSKDPSKLIVAINILNRVDLVLSECPRGQLSSDALDQIHTYLVKAVKAIPEDIKEVNSIVFTISRCITQIEDLKAGKVMAATNESKEYLVSTISNLIIDLKVKTGIYLTDHEFEFRENMTPILRDIVEVCLKNKYYFGY